MCPIQTLRQDSIYSVLQIAAYFPESFMNRKSHPCAVALLFASLSFQSANSQPATNSTPQPFNVSNLLPGATNYTIVERGPHYRIVQHLSVETNLLDNQAIIRANSKPYM